VCEPAGCHREYVTRADLMRQLCDREPLRCSARHPPGLATARCGHDPAPASGWGREQRINLGRPHLRSVGVERHQRAGGLSRRVERGKGHEQPMVFGQNLLSADGDPFDHSAQAFMAIGSILGRRVPCLSAVARCQTIREATRRGTPIRTTRDFFTTVLERLCCRRTRRADVSREHTATPM
jgi:hypothetical protein